jgi:hypothetical protein
MRLSPDKVHAIRHAAQRVLGERAQIRVFGSMAQGDRKIDVLLKDANTPPAPIFDIAKRTGVLL